MGISVQFRCWKYKIVELHSVITTLIRRVVFLEHRRDIVHVIRSKRYWLAPILVHAITTRAICFSN